MISDLYTCPRCKRPHALCVLIQRGGKRVLGVNCDVGQRLGHTRFVRIPQSVIDESDFGDISRLPQYFTGPEKKRLAEMETMDMTCKKTIMSLRVTPP